MLKQKYLQFMSGACKRECKLSKGLSETSSRFLGTPQFGGGLVASSAPSNLNDVPSLPDMLLIDEGLFKN